jgi:rhomboid protease GluP
VRASVTVMRQNALRQAVAVPWSVWAVAALCVIPELMLLGADWGLWGTARWRAVAYTQGAFWAGLLYGWTPNYPQQPVTMFFSHAWLHAGPGHLAGNMVALLWLGPQVAARRGNGGLLIFWGLSALGGGAAFGLLTSSPAPMVGASGALFGLAAEWVVAEVRRISGFRARLRRGLGLVAILFMLNVVTWVLQGGQLAWETHLGGFLTGMGLAVLWRGTVDPGEDPVIGGQEGGR